MSRPMNQRVTLRRYPEGVPTQDHFRIVEAPIPVAGEGQVLNRTVYLSLDPYMRVMMREGVLPIDATMPGSTVRAGYRLTAPRLRAGGFGLGENGWQDYGVADGAKLRNWTREWRPSPMRWASWACPG